MPIHEFLLPAVILLGVVAILWLVWTIRAELDADRGVETDQLSAALGETWREMGLERTVGQLETHASEMRAFHGDISQMLRTPQQRGEFGEQQLDVMLGDHLPPEMYGIRERVVDGKTPDAHIRSSAGVICIDSKFPLDNYERFLEADTETERDRYRRQFREDVQRQLEKIAADYVQPDAGTTEFAFAFIPSESVYYHLITTEYDLLRAFTGRGVQVVSPLTLGHKLELIKADVQARKLSDQAAEILDHLDRLRTRFAAVEDEWQTLHTHIRNAKNKADDLDRSYAELRSAFDRIEEPTVED